VASAIFTVSRISVGSSVGIAEWYQWSASYTMILAGIRASFALFDGAWKAVMRSPTGWHDRTPVCLSLVRILSDAE
jgi:ATP-binding cassette subfamily C (CFTR/MRP) protein 1